MPVFNGIKYREMTTDIIVVHMCPYCGKKFLNKNSYRGHIVGKYCQYCDIETGKSIFTEIPLDWLNSKIENDI